MGRKIEEGFGPSEDIVLLIIIDADPSPPPDDPGMFEVLLYEENEFVGGLE